MDRNAAFILPLMRAYLLIDARQSQNASFGGGWCEDAFNALTAIENAIDRMALAMGLATDGPFGAHGEIFKALWTSARADLGMPC